MLDQDKTKEQLISELGELRQRIRTEELLKESENQFSNLSESAPDAIVLVNNAGTIIFWNSSASMIFGYEKDEAIGMPLINIVGAHEAHVQAIERFQLNDCSSLNKNVFESKGIRKNGQLFPVEIAVSFCETTEGGLYGAIIRDISQRQNTEELLRRSEQQYRSVVETSSDTIITVDNQNKIISWNKGAEIIFGYTAAEILNNSLFTLVPERLHAAHSQKTMELSSSKTNTVMIAQNPSWGKRKDGSEFFAEASVAKWETEEGSFMTLTLRDITRRHMIENALRRSEEQYRSVIETASDAIITTDLQGTIITWNKGAENIYGYSADEIINKLFIVLFPEHFTLVNQNRMLEHFAQHNMGIIFQDTQIPATRKDGSEFIAEGAVSKWESNEGIFLTAIVRDITERKKAEEALRRSEIKYRSVIESAYDAIITTDSAGIIVAWNNGAQQIFGYSANEIINKPYLTLMPERLHAKYLQRLKGFEKNNNNVQRGESFGRRKDGREFPAEGSLSMWKTDEGVFFTTTARDISDRKRAEEALKQSEERYRLTADMVPIHLGATDQSYKYSIWNKYSEKMFGYTQEEALNKMSPLDIHETAEEAQEVVDTAINTGIFDKELQFRRKNGNLFPAHLIVVPDRDREGNLKGLYGFAEDITTRRKAEHIVNQVDNCLLSLTPDPDSNIQYLVESAGKILGGDCSAYHSIRGSRLNIKAEWNVPVAHKNMYSLKGSPFLHLLSQYGAEPFIINNSEELAHVANESLSFHVPYKTLLAITVRTGNRITGSLHIAYSQPQAFSKTELNAFSILSQAIAIEEERKKTLFELKRKQKLLSKSEKTLKLFSSKVLSIREEEKKNISRALHDEIGSAVVALSAQLALAKFEIIENNLDQAIRNIAQTEATLKQSVEKLKSIAVDLRPPDLNIVGLSTALKIYFLCLSEKLNIAIDFTSTLKDLSIPEETGIILYRVCQEALNNAASHAKASTVSVQLTSKRGYINLAIQDDGCGFDLKKLPYISSHSSKLGIIGMRERVESLNGTFAIESHINKGTAVFATVPHR